jgi:hypothetical protein
MLLHQISSETSLLLLHMILLGPAVFFVDPLFFLKKKRIDTVWGLGGQNLKPKSCFHGLGASVRGAQALAAGAEAASSAAPQINQKMRGAVHLSIHPRVTYAAHLICHRILSTIGFGGIIRGKFYNKTGGVKAR